MGFTADPYDVLKVKPTADSTEVSQAYHNLARQLHPDKNNAPNAKEVFQNLHQAYRVLSDPAERAKLDNQRAAKEREVQRLQQAREIQLKYQQQLIEQKAREKAFLVQEHQQKLAREQAMQNKMKLNGINQNPKEINQEIIYDPHHDATAKWLLEQFGIQTKTNDLGNNSNLRVDSVKKRSKSPVHLVPGGNGPSRPVSPQPGVDQGSYVKINVQPRANNVHSMNNMHNVNSIHSMNNIHNVNTMHNGNSMHNGNNMHNGNIMHNMNNTNNHMNRTNSVKFQQRPLGNAYNQQLPGNAFNQQLPANTFNQQLPGNAFNQQLPSQGTGQGGFQHIRVDSINRRPRPLPKTPPDVKLRQQNRSSSSMVFDLSMLESQLMEGVCNNPDIRTTQKEKSPGSQTQAPQKVMLIKVVSNPLQHH